MPKLLIALALALTFLVRPAPAETGADAAGVRATIDAQLEAFARDDWDGAFTFASPMIQRLFGTPENFGQMVRNGYPMVWRPAWTAFVGVEPTPEGLRQTVVLTDQTGRTYVADYFMIQVDGEWRINGVVIRPQVDAGA
jgi:hypothetical protein